MFYVYISTRQKKPEIRKVQQVRPIKILKIRDIIAAKTMEVFGYFPPGTVKSVRKQLKALTPNEPLIEDTFMIRKYSEPFLGAKKEVELTNIEGRVLKMTTCSGDETKCSASHKNLFRAVRELLSKTNGRSVHTLEPDYKGEGIVIGAKSKMVIGKNIRKKITYKVPQYQEPQFMTIA